MSGPKNVADTDIGEQITSAMREALAHARGEIKLKSHVYPKPHTFAWADDAGDCWAPKFNT